MIFATSTVSYKRQSVWKAPDSLKESFIQILLKQVGSIDLYDTFSRTCKNWRVICEKEFRSKMTLPFFVGAHANGQNQISFFYFPSIPKNFWIQSDEIFGKVRIKEAKSAEELSGLLHNVHVRPVYNPSKKKVNFENIDVKIWQLQGELELPDCDTKCLCRSNGSISYAFYDTITTFTWESGISECYSLPTRKITALAELDGELLIGDEKGLFFSEKTGWINLEESEITNIIIVDKNQCLVEFNNNKKCRLDLEMGVVSYVYKSSDQVLLVREGVYATLSENCVHIKGIKNRKYASDQECLSIKRLADDYLLILRKKNIVIWNIDNNVTEIIDDRILRSYCYSDNFIFLGESSFIYPRNTTINKFSDGESEELASIKSWGITTMALLSDGTLICGTNTRGSAVYIVTMEGEVIPLDKSITQEQVVRSFTELIDGSVVIQLQNRICRLKCHTNEETEEQTYQSYLAGMERAVKSGDLYKARRFYEKARQLFPESEEPISLFLWNLEATPHQKLRERILLDLHQLNKDIPENPERKCKKRLFLGEGNFSYTEALLKKHAVSHPKLKYAIVATEFLEPHGKKTKERVEGLIKQGIKILFGIDGQKIHQNFRGKRFQRIHWNCPFGGSSPNDREAFKKVMPNFFKACSQIQIAGDRVHVTLMQGWQTEKGDQRQRENPIVLGSKSSGYRLIRKRNFGENRYPGYQHVMTGINRNYSGGGLEREFVFEKGNSQIHEKNYKIRTKVKDSKDWGDYYFECSTDEDSSTYYESDESS